MKKLHFSVFHGVIILSACFVVLFASSAALGQEVTAGVTGTVTDPTGAPISGARVTAQDRGRVMAGAATVAQ